MECSNGHLAISQARSRLKDAAGACEMAFSSHGALPVGKHVDNTRRWGSTPMTTSCERCLPHDKRASLPYPFKRMRMNPYEEKAVV